jgi:hypothetical protein
MNKHFISILFFISCLVSSAQGSQPAMADDMRADGKIYVVIGVLLIIFISIVGFLVVLERRIKKMEDKVKSKN